MSNAGAIRYVTQDGFRDGRGGFAYLVRWPDEGIVKIGVTRTPKRWAPWMATGGRVLALAQDTPRTNGDWAGVRKAEQFMHGLLVNHLNRPFGRKQEAARFLPKDGSGWSECYSDDGAISLALFNTVCHWLVWEPCKRHDDNKCQYDNLYQRLWIDSEVPW